MRRLILAAALALGAGGIIPVVSAALPAQAINCTFGNNFYEFVSDYAYAAGEYNGQIVGTDAILKLNVDTDGSWFCQVNTGFGGNFYEWVERGTALCITLNYNADDIDMITCQSLASQEWELFDDDGANQLGEDYGGMWSGYTTHGDLYMAMPSTSQSYPDQWFTGWTDGSGSKYGWTLDHF